MKRILKIALIFLVMGLLATVMCNFATAYDEIGLNEANVNDNIENAENIWDLVAAIPEMPDSTGTKYYYYRQLTDVEKAIYQRILSMPFDSSGIMRFSGLENYTQEELDLHANRAAAACISDNPFLHSYWNRVIGTCFSDGIAVLTLHSENGELYSPQGIRDEVEARADIIVSAVGYDGDLYSRLRRLVTIMAYEMDYEAMTMYNAKTPFYNDSILGCLVDGYAVCAGFADTFKYLCDRLEIPSIVVGNAAHAWNYVQMEDGQWYSVDTSAIASADGLPDVSSQNDFIKQELLVGSISTASGIYAISELYIARPNDFVFPTLSREQYVYDGDFAYSYSPLPEPELPSLSFFYTVNEDQVSCTINGCQGKRNGDLVIPENLDGYIVTAIGAGAFHGNTSFTGQLVLPSTLMEIKAQAFARCENLTGIYRFPDGLLHIEEAAFCACERLSGDIVLPEGLQHLGASAFGQCKNLTGVFYIPDAVSFEANILSLTGIQSVSVSDTNENYMVQNGLLISKDGNKLVYCPPGMSGELTVPNGITEIGDSACERCVLITGLHLPDSLVRIGKWAFGGCNSLTGDLILPDSIESIGYGAFSRDMQYPFGGTLYLPANLKILEDWAFANCGFTGDLFIPDALESIEGDQIFAYKGGAFVCSETNTVFINWYNNLTVNKWFLRTITPRENYEITISFNANGGDNTPEVIETYCGMTCVFDKTPVRDGFVFLGWNENPSSQVIQYRKNGQYFFEDSKLLYAVWEELSQETSGVYDDFAWVQHQNKTMITGYFGDQLCVIPDYIEGLPVCGIGPSVFENSWLDRISFPIHIEWVAENNFKYLLAIDYQGSRTDWDRIDFATGNEAILSMQAFFSWDEGLSTVTATRINDYGISGGVVSETVNTEKTVLVNPTCTGKGFAIYSARFQNFFWPADRYVKEPSLGHDLEHHEAKAATCTEAGNTAYWTCGTCHKLFSDADGKTEIAQTATVIPATGHSFTKTEAKAATCTEAGNTAYWTCSHCGECFGDANGNAALVKDSWVIDALGHSWGNWNVTSPATEDQEGEETRTCSRCHQTETRPIEKLPITHNLISNARLDGNIVYVTIDRYVGGTLLAALYSSDGKMLNAVLKETNSINLEYELIFGDLTNSGMVKLFYVNLEGMQPLCDAIPLS